MSYKEGTVSEWTEESDVQVIAASLGWKLAPRLDNPMPGVSRAGMYNSHAGLYETEQAWVIWFALKFSSPSQASEDPSSVKRRLLSDGFINVGIRPRTV